MGLFLIVMGVGVVGADPGGGNPPSADVVGTGGGTAASVEWSTNTSSRGSVGIRAADALDLRVFKCNSAYATLDLGDVSGTLDATFDWESGVSRQYWEISRYQVISDNRTLIDSGFGPGTPNTTVTGTYSNATTVDGPTSVRFLLRPTQFCSNGDHGFTYFNVSDISLSLDGNTIVGDNTTAVDPTLVVDGDADGDDEYATIQAAVDDASDGDRIEVLSGTYRETVVLNGSVEVVAPNGATLNGSGLGPGRNGRFGFQIGGSAAPTIEGFEIERYVYGVEEAQSAGNWTVKNSTLRTERQGIFARDGNGGVTVRNVDVVSESDGISMGPRWTITDSTIKSGGRGLNLGGSGTIRDTLVRDTAFEGGINIRVSDQVRLDNVTVRNATGNGLRISGPDPGAWEIVDSEITGTTVEQSRAPDDPENGYAIAAFAGNGTVRRTTIDGNAVGGIRALSFSSTVDARKNWWGSPSGHAPDDCVGLVDCRRPLDAPPEAGGRPQTKGPKTAVVDGDADGDDEYATIQAAVDRADPADRVEVRRGVYTKPSNGDNAHVRLGKDVTLVAPNGAVLEDTVGDNTGIFVGDTAQSPVVDGFTLRGFDTGLEVGSTGDWTVKNVTVINGTREGIAARDADGAWTISNATVVDSGGISAFEAEGSWAIRDSVVRNASTGISVRFAAGGWSVTDTRIDGVSSGIQADSTTGDWSVLDTAITNSTVGIEAEASAGDWIVRNTRIDGASNWGVVARDASGDWRVTRSALTNDREIDARRAALEGDATGNWWGQPGGPAVDDCEGNVDCGRPLSSPPSVGPRATGAPPRGQNLPPVAELTVRPSTPSSIDPAVLSATDSRDPDGDALTYRWDLGANGTVDASGPRVNLSLGVGRYPVVLTVSDGTANATVQREIQVRPPDERPNATAVVERNGIEQRSPVSLPLGSQAVLNASGSTVPDNRSLDSITWEFPDGTTATDATAVRTFNSLGNRTVTLAVTDSEGVTDAANLTIEVTRPPAPVVTKVVQPGNGIIPQAPLNETIGGFPNTWRAEVEPNASVRNVTFVFPNGQRITDSNGSDGWTATLARDGGLKTLTDGEVTVTATDARGRTGRDVTTIDTFGLPVWGKPYETVGVSDRIDEVQGGISLDTPSVSFPLLAANVSGAFGVNPEVTHAVGTRQGTLGGDGSIQLLVQPSNGPGVGIDGAIDIEGNATVGNDSLVLRTANVTGIVEPRVVPRLGSPQTPIGEIDVSAEVGGVYAAMVEANVSEDVRNISIERGEYTYGLLFRPTASAGLETAIVPGIPITFGSVTVGGQIRANGTLVVDDPLAGAITGSGKVFYEVTFLIFTNSAEVTYNRTLASFGGGTATGVPSLAGSVRHTGWRRIEKRGEHSPGDEFGAGGEGSGSGDGAGVGAAGGSVTPLTNDTLADQQPAVAQSNDAVTGVWTAQRPDRSIANGTELVASDYGNGTWESPRRLTDDGRYDAFPAVGTAGGTRAVAWVRANNSVPVGALARPADLASRFDLRVGTIAGARIANRTRLTNDSLPDLAPAVAGTDDGWLVAWLQDTDGNLTTSRDRRAEYALLASNLTAVRQRGSVSNVTAVDAAADGDALVLATRSATDGTVVRRSFAPDGRLDARSTYGARNATAVATTGNATVWTDGRTVTVARGGDSQSFRTAAGGARGLQVTRAGDRTVVTYRSKEAANRSLGVFYHVQNRSAGGWTDAERLGARSLRAQGAGVTASGDSLVGLVESAPNATVNADVFGVRQRFGPPDLRLDATVGDVQASTTPVEVTVTNDGDRTAEATTVRLERPDGTVQRATVDSLHPGEAVTRTVDVDRPLAGTGNVSIAPVAAESETGNNAERITLPTNVSITRVTDRLTANRERLAVPATVRNEGPLPVRNVTYTLRVGGETTTGRLPGVAVGRSWQVTPAVDASSVEPAADAVVRFGSVDAAIGTVEREIDVHQPDAGVGDPLRYASSGSEYGRPALIPVFSGDTGETGAEVTVRTPADAVSYRVPLPAARSESDSVSRPVALTLPPASANDSVRLSVRALNGSDTNPGDDLAIDAVPANASGSVPTPELGPVVATPGTGSGTTVTATLHNPASVYLGGALRVETAAANATVTTTLPPNGTATVRTTVNGSGPVTVRTVSERRRVTVTSGPPPVAGSTPPGDPDGDGRYEDVDGDGTLDVFDALTYYRNRGRSPIRDRPAAFDFDGDGAAGTVFDALALYEEIRP